MIVKVMQVTESIPQTWDKQSPSMHTEWMTVTKRGRIMKNKILSGPIKPSP